jgi:hypothetical protein
MDSGANIDGFKKVISRPINIQPLRHYLALLRNKTITIIKIRFYINELHVRTLSLVGYGLEAEHEYFNGPWLVGA